MVQIQEQSELIGWAKYTSPLYEWPSGFRPVTFSSHDILSDWLLQNTFEGPSESHRRMFGIDHVYAEIHSTTIELAAQDGLPPEAYQRILEIRWQPISINPPRELVKILRESGYKRFGYTLEDSF